MKLAIAPVALSQKFVRRVAVPVPDAPPWPPFVVAALVLTLTVGALSGAFDLWRLRIALNPVPLDHHRAHALGQLFGFLGLFTLGVSLHLGPRFFGASSPSPARVRFLRWAGIGGVVLAIAGRFGALLPGSQVYGPLGAALLLAALSAWLELAFSWWQTPGARDVMQRFVLAGTAWWWVAGATFFVWHLAQWVTGPVSALPLAAVWAPALFGGGASWLWGVFLRAGLCTLQVPRPSERAQHAWFWGWQVGVALTTLASWVPALEPLARGSMVVAVGLTWAALRPHRSEAGSPQARAVRAGLAFVLVFGALQAWSVLGAFGVWTPALLTDASRHAFSLGGATLMLFGFAGRMVPGFSGVLLAWPRAYEYGTWTVMFAALARVLELVPGRAGLALSAASGGLSLLGVGLVASALFATLANARRQRLGETSQRVPSAALRD